MADAAPPARDQARPDKYFCRSVSIGWSEPDSLTCQKLQPLHDGADCSAAPTLWIEPECVSQASDPSAQTFACQRRLASLSIVPAGIRPLSTRRPKATRGCERLSATVCIALSSSGSVEAMRCFATFT